jgi:molybdopterin/thiamine biosynthesis adenylyltransferase
VTLNLAYSRPQKTADQLGALAEDRHRFLNKCILLTGEAYILAKENGKDCLLDCIRLLVRICPNITVAIPAPCAALLDVARTLSHDVTFGQELEFCHEVEDLTIYDAILSVGSAVRPELPWTTINSNGWVARVTSGNKELPGECDLTNPIGALAAACLGTGEVFKRLIRLRSERGELLNGFSYSLRTYRHSTGDCGPELPLDLHADLLVVGAGAIGNGLVHLISQLHFSGRITIVDSQEFGVENLGTCILIGPGDLARPKADALAGYLREAAIDAQGFHMPFERFVRKSRTVPAIVINGLDNLDARHEVQRSLWPDVVIDGAIGDFTCQVSRHPWPDDIACLVCLFRKPGGRRAEDLQSEETGLSRERLMRPDIAITQSDVDGAPIEKQDFLRSRIGRPVCSVIQEAMAQKISEERHAEGFEPSVPFVACFSACMVMAETAAQICGWPSILAPRFQFDFLVGPAHGQELPQQRRADCVCVRHKNINTLREARIGKAQCSRDRDSRSPTAPGTGSGASRV